MNWCTSCVTPDTRPNLTLDANRVCNACDAAAMKHEIDWKQREDSFMAVVDAAKAQKRDYDCVIPVSGGKDSHWQVIKCLELGLNPLCVTWKAPSRTVIGQANLQNLINLGVDHIDWQINPFAEKKFLVKALDRFGATAIPMHLALFNIPLKVAVKFAIPLVVWGENSAFEYGGKEDERMGFSLNTTWLKKYGIAHGTTWKDWVDADLSEAELSGYKGPMPEELESKGIKAVFMGYYYAWDPETSLKIAIAHGFKRAESAKTGVYDYADIDDDFISIHHYLKWYKFGFTRVFDNLSLEIRNGRTTRDQAIAVIKQMGDQTPHRDIETFCSHVGMSKPEFFKRIEKFRNSEVWQHENGTWKIKNFLIRDWNWS